MIKKTNKKKADKSVKEKSVHYNSDFDDIFKSMKYRNVKLFIPVINESFGRHYTQDDEMTILPSEGDIAKIANGNADIDSRTLDFLIKIRNELYMLECQSYHDGTMAFRIAEYAFISARQNAVWENGQL